MIVFVRLICEKLLMLLINGFVVILMVGVLIFFLVSGKRFVLLFFVWLFVIEFRLEKFILKFSFGINNIVKIKV